MINIAILASGTGTNARQIIDRFQDNKYILVDCIITNRQKAGVIEIAESAGIPYFHFNNDRFASGQEILNFLNERGIKWIILAGFLRKIPTSIIDVFRNRIINIHPALLPKYGGRGMYGANVHEAVLLANEKESGISIHFVNENFDEGQIIFQKSCQIEKTDRIESLSKKVQLLEHRYFPQVIEDTIIAELKESTNSPT